MPHWPTDGVLRIIGLFASTIILIGQCLHDVELVLTAINHLAYDVPSNTSRQQIQQRQRGSSSSAYDAKWCLLFCPLRMLCRWYNINNPSSDMILDEKTTAVKNKFYEVLDEWKSGETDTQQKWNAHLNVARRNKCLSRATYDNKEMFTRWKIRF